MVFVAACNSPQLQQPAHRAGSEEISCSGGDKRSAFGAVQGSNGIKKKGGVKLKLCNALWQLLRELAAEFDRNRNRGKEKERAARIFPRLACGIYQTAASTSVIQHW